MTDHQGIITFLKTTRTKEELATTLAVLKEFKQCESRGEWAAIMFAAWAKLEQFEEFLEHLVNGAELEDDTKQVLGLDVPEPPDQEPLT